MIRPDQIPDEVVKTVMHCFHTQNSARASIAAALNAWPGRTEYAGFDADDTLRHTITLPMEVK